MKIIIHDKYREMKAEEEVEAVEEKPEPSIDDIASGLKEAEEDRDAKFLLYWATTTSTSTSYTSTSTIATVNCTPASFTISVCG